MAAWETDTVNELPPGRALSARPGAWVKGLCLVCGQRLAHLGRIAGNYDTESRLNSRPWFGYQAAPVIDLLCGERERGKLRSQGAPCCGQRVGMHGGLRTRRAAGVPA
jgi:hypothetical protein